ASPPPPHQGDNRGHQPGQMCQSAVPHRTFACRTVYNVAHFGELFMRPRLLVLCLGFQILAAVASGSPVAGPALDDDKTASPSSGTPPEASAATTAPGKAVEYGVGIR